MNRLLYAIVTGLIVTFTLFCGAGVMVAILAVAHKFFAGTFGPMWTTMGAMFLLTWAILVVGIYKKWGEHEVPRLDG